MARKRAARFSRERPLVMLLKRPSVSSVKVRRYYSNRLLAGGRGGGRLARLYFFGLGGRDETAVLTQGVDLYGVAGGEKNPPGFPRGSFFLAHFFLLFS